MERNSTPVFLRLLRHVLPYRRVFLLAVLAMVVLAATEPAIPALLKPTLDGSFVDKDSDTVTLMAVLLVGIFLVRGLSSYLSGVALAWVSGRLVLDLRRKMFEKLMRLPVRYYDEHSVGNLISKVTFDASQVTEAGTYVLTILVRDSLAIIGLLGWMLYLDWKLTLIALVTAPLLVFVVKYFSRRLRNMSQRLQASMGDVTHVLDESIAGHRVVRTYGGQEHEQRRFERSANAARRYQLKFASAQFAVAPIGQLLTAIALGLILYVAGHQSIDGEISVGTFVSFFGAMAFLFSPLKRLTGVNAPLQKGVAAAISVFDLVDERSETDSGSLSAKNTAGAIEFRDLSFSYATDSGLALDRINLQIAAGETVALVGPSGSGKTTIANLVPRFYAPDTGAVFLDGVDIQELQLTSLRAQIALVSQDIVLFDDTVAANIAYGPLSTKSQSDIEAAARQAYALEFIENLPQGMDTMIGERGVKLSGGQRQRLAIARAFLKDAPILILDEATSSLDTESERQIQLAIESLGRNRTTVIIAHRLSTIERADRIVVLRGGRIVEVGTHEALLANNDLYASLYRFRFSPPAPVIVDTDVR